MIEFFIWLVFVTRFQNVKTKLLKIFFDYNFCRNYFVLGSMGVYLLVFGVELNNFSQISKKLMVLCYRFFAISTPLPTWYRVKADDFAPYGLRIESGTDLVSFLCLELIIFPQKMNSRTSVNRLTCCRLGCLTIDFF